MPNEKRQNHLELVESLASSIQKKLVEPAEDRVELVNCELRDLSARVTDLEEKVALLAAKHGRTRLLACVSLVAAALMFLAQQMWMWHR
ncbi:hypothetical protein Psch_03766 [Pelotomaculum schinkii]|uniref:Hemolysin XhlA n=1 Tax=Pelotomaculum schinkii TaxID=78350 RepID=A0A4Y7R8I9_9FIRM|nr:hypothetical protein [Pelotomaculum schinkii]TEB05003.1 hypothetical protein Psch_03766 [Pelotomaculum schinkii]